MSKTIQANLDGRVCIVTGANTGMGRETARALAGFGATVVLACRSAERGNAAREEIVRESGNPRVEVATLDLASFAAVRRFAADVTARHSKIDVLVNNAGLWLLERKLGADGHELQWSTNVLGPHLLTGLLLDALVASRRGRVINVASSAAGGLDLDDPDYERRPYSGFRQYSATKQANRMLTWALARRLEGTGVTANALNPGLVSTELNRSANAFFKAFFFVTKPFAKSARDGADTAIWLAASPEVEGLSGRFWEGRKEIPCKFRQPEDPIERLWDLCERATRGGATGAVAA